VLELRDVGKVYGAEPPVHALREVSLGIGAGELVAIVGPSGSGKTTLLHVMGTLERPTSGVVAITGLDAALLSDRELATLRATRIGFVFQQFFLAEHSTALENVADGLLYAGAAVAERRERAAVALARVGLAGRAAFRPSKLRRRAPARRDRQGAGRPPSDRARRRADRQPRQRRRRSSARAARRAQRAGRDDRRDHPRQRARGAAAAADPGARRAGRGGHGRARGGTPMSLLRRRPLALALAAGALAAPAAASGQTGGPGESSCPSPNPPDQLTLVAGTPQTAPLSAAFAGNLQVALTNSDGCPVTGAAGVPVTFSAPSAGASGRFAASNSNAVTVGADAAGAVAAPTFVANGTAGSYAVIAASPYGSVSFSLTNTAAGVPAQVVALPGASKAKVTERFAAPLRARVLDASGDPVTGAAVTFTLASGAAGRCEGTAAAGASFAGATTQATASTDANGIAVSPPLVAGSVAGSFTASASVSEGGGPAEGAGRGGTIGSAARPATFALADLAGAPHTITPGIGARQKAATGSAFPIRLAVTVTDAEHNPVPGALVSFSAPASGASGRFTVRANGGHRGRARDSSRRRVAIRTGACGVAVAPRFSADGAAGGYVVKAGAGSARPAAFALVNEAG
jgi:protocatechuate 3,4-dioxygenase beta subunit